ncbi:hypothetical protein L4X63_04455 [Geomonas sp. Red32]|uniref:hypothetical protein n=1 Tax=Geomonas sp. Red32 TaxID=2912856 RepID=UPI00202CDCD7|nr:hypothetical protein [Geomonas sp. Red32]MCM0080837.1 hypothetical protein [Geomonas sp. Red32]
MTCPKCDHEQERAAVCARCGLIFAKYASRASQSKVLEEQAAAPAPLPEPEAPAPAKPVKPPGWPQLVTGCLAALILCLPLVRMMGGILAGSHLISEKGDIGTGILLVMLVLFTNGVIALYGAAVSFKKTIFGPAFATHVTVVVVVSQFTVGGGLSFRFFYAIYAVILLCISSGVMALAKWATRGVMIFNCLALLLLANYQTVSRLYKGATHSMQVGIDNRKHQAELKAIDEFWSKVFAGTIRAEELKAKHPKLSAPEVADEEISLLERRIAAEKPHLEERLLDAMLDLFSGKHLEAVDSVTLDKPSGMSDEEYKKYYESTFSRKDYGDRAICALVTLPELPPNIIDRIISSATSPAPLIAFAKYPQVTPAILKAVFDRSRRVNAEREITEAFKALASNPGTSPQVMSALAGTRSVLIMKDLAANQGCPQDLLERLAQSTIDRVADAAGNNPAASPKVKEIYYLRSHFSSARQGVRPRWKEVLGAASVPGSIYIDTTAPEPAFHNAYKLKTLVKLTQPLRPSDGSDATCGSTYAMEESIVVLCAADEFVADESVFTRGIQLFHQTRYDSTGKLIKELEIQGVHNFCTPNYSFDALKRIACPRVL